MEKEIPNPCDTPRVFNGTLWCDDYSDVYVGNCDSLTERPIASHNYNGSATTAFKFEAKCCDYIYFACWSNDVGANGFLAQVSGATTVLTNSTDWEVFATGLDFDSLSPRPTRDSVFAQIKKADCHKYWTKPTLGPKNAGTPTPISFTVPSISSNANFIWFDTGSDNSSANPPFSGFNHNEYLIFRLSMKKLFPKDCAKCTCEDCECCDCGCSGCNENAKEQEQTLAGRAKSKSKIIVGTGNSSLLCSPAPYIVGNEKPCSNALNIKSLGLCFYLHWGDSPQDQIESSDCFETLYITVCNPYKDLLFKGLRVTKITIIPSLPISQMQLVPDGLVCFDCLEPCSCKSREFALNTRNVPPGIYNIQVEYCTDEVSVVMNTTSTTSFPITVIQD